MRRNPALVPWLLWILVVGAPLVCGCWNKTEAAPEASTPAKIGSGASDSPEHASCQWEAPAVFSPPEIVQSARPGSLGEVRNAQPDAVPVAAGDEKPPDAQAVPAGRPPAAACLLTTSPNAPRDRRAGVMDEPVLPFTSSPVPERQSRPAASDRLLALPYAVAPDRHGYPLSPLGPWGHEAAGQPIVPPLEPGDRVLLPQPVKERDTAAPAPHADAGAASAAGVATASSGPATPATGKTEGGSSDAGIVLVESLAAPQEAAAAVPVPPRTPIVNLPPPPGSPAGPQAGADLQRFHGLQGFSDPLSPATGDRPELTAARLPAGRAEDLPPAAKVPAFSDVSVPSMAPMTGTPSAIGTAPTSTASAPPDANQTPPPPQPAVPAALGNMAMGEQHPPATVPPAPAVVPSAPVVASAAPPSGAAATDRPEEQPRGPAGKEKSPGRAENGSKAVAAAPPTEAPSVPAAPAAAKPVEDRPAADVVKAPAAPASPPPAAGTPGAADDRGEAAQCDLMTVFYATDRQPIASPSGAEGTRVEWVYLAAIAGGVSLVLVVLAFCHPRNRFLFFLSGAGMAGTVLLAYAAYHAGRPETVPPVRAERAYGDDRGQVERGVCHLTVPRTGDGHRAGPQRRGPVFRFSLPEDAERRGALFSVTPQADDEFFKVLRSRVERSETKEAWVFIHGFNMSFETAARRTAQLASDLRFDGAAVFFSWPAQSGRLRYAADEANIAWSAAHFRDFLVAVTQRCGAKAVNLVAHGMGSRAAVAALETLAAEQALGAPLFREIALAVPDVDADAFRSTGAPALVRAAGRVTLYASSDDPSLRLSKEIRSFPRAGDAGSGLVVVPGIDTIDASAADASLGREFDAGDRRLATVGDDLGQLLSADRPPGRRVGLQAASCKGLRYWVLAAAGNPAESTRLGDSRASKGTVPSLQR
jgi:predicted alpha/beta hydrolase family esterase